jgi:hypothetical protein
MIVTCSKCCETGQIVFLNKNISMSMLVPAEKVHSSTPLSEEAAAAHSLSQMFSEFPGGKSNPCLETDY